MNKIFVTTNTNCRRRLLDTQKIKLYFQRNNWNVLDKPNKADQIIFVTCAYRDEIADDCLEQIKEMQNRSGELIVVGQPQLLINLLFLRQQEKKLFFTGNLGFKSLPYIFKIVLLENKCKKIFFLKSIFLSEISFP